VTGESHSLSISNLKVFKKMDKKMYFEPEMEVINLKLQGMLCGSPTGDPDEDSGEAPQSDVEIP